ncbi:MAG: Asp-tRNA(Asn)/Glu-tRNA(Gln) amidotransferase subunit GatC [Fibrobacterales bacterium]
MITNEDVLRLGKLSRIAIKENEIEGYKKHLEKLVGYMDELQELDLANVEPMTRVDDHVTDLRPDVPGVSLSREEAFKNAPATGQDHFTIPKVIG